MQDSSNSQGVYPSALYSRYVVAILLLVGTLSFLDRQILSLLVGPVRHDFHLTDTQLSLLQGLSFALLFSLFGLPLGSLVDRANRRNIIAAGLFIWSVMTMLCGLAHTFGQLFAGRMGVGLGEACLGPAAISLISDYFPPARRGAALSFYVLSTSVGIGASLMIGGAMLHHLNGSSTVILPLLGITAGWKAILLMAGIPGLAAVPLIFTIREVPRQEIAAGDTKANFGQFLGFLAEAPRAYIGLYVALGLVSFIGYGAGSWAPTFFIRRFAMVPAAAGVRVGAITALCGLVGCLSSGLVSDWLSRKQVVGSRFRTTLVGFAMMAPSVALFPRMPTLQGSMIVFGFFTFANAFSIASGPSALQAVMPNRLRGKASALYYLLLAIFGVACGPTAVALMTDRFFHNDKDLGLSISIVPACAALLGILIVGYSQYAYQERIVVHSADAANVSPTR